MTAGAAVGVAEAAAIKACCAAAYSGPAARYLLGDSLHPGGFALTDELVGSLRARPGAVVVDVGSGPGASALRLAHRTGCRVIGVDLAPELIAEATRRAEAAGCADRVRFVKGDAESLPLGEGAADGVLSECALCTVPDKSAAVRELVRVLRPGGRFAISDMTADPERLPAELRSLAGWVACIGGAQPLGTTALVLEQAGLAVELAAQRDRVLVELVDRVGARLRAARLLGVPGLEGEIERGLELVRAARSAVDAGVLGYGVLVGHRP